MQITRLYNDSSGNLLRIDYIDIEVSPPIYKDLRLGNDPGLMMRVGPQIVKTKIMGGNISGGRVVATIEISGDFSAWDTSGPDYNITWATYTLGNNQVVRFDMSNLPVVGDTV